MLSRPNITPFPVLHSYIVIENSDRSLQPYLLNSISFISTCTNFLLFFLILSKPRNESRLYRLVFLIQNVSLWLSQLHWATFHSLVFLFPFPGLYGIGFLTKFISSYVLVIIWILLFATAVLMLFVILLVRLHGIARFNGYFHISNSTYFIFTALLTAYIYIPITFCWISAGSSESESREFVSAFYPNAVKVLDIQGVFIYTDEWKFRRILVVAMVLLGSGGLLYVALCQIIVYEIRQNCRTWSVKVMKYHKKALKDTLIQNAVLGVFLAVAPGLQIMNAFKDPEADTITATMLTNAVFVAAPIPFSMTILFQNTSYRQFILSKFKKQTCKKQECMKRVGTDSDSFCCPSDEMREIDNRTYATIDLTDRTLQLYLTNSANLLVTPVNFLAFYLIVTKSKKEQKLYKYTLLSSHVFFYIANVFYGSIANMVLLFPFPAISTIGLLRNVMSSFWSSLIWIFLFAVFVFLTFIILLVRLRIVARKGGKFDFSDSTYIYFSVFLFLYIYSPLSALWINAYNTKQVQMEFVEEYFPANLKAFDNPSIHVDISQDNQTAIIILLFVLVFTGLSAYSLVYFIVIFEIKQQAIFKSSRMTKHHRKVTNSALFQIAILANFVCLSLLVLVRNAFVDPEEDTRVPTALANTCLILASIPCQLFMIFTNSSYRLALFRTVRVSLEATTEFRNSPIVVSARQSYVS